MKFDLKGVLDAVGPMASLIFAAWIFLGYLQQRFGSSYERYRALINEFRHHGQRDERRKSLLEQILEYKRRCEHMRLATHIGLIAAIMLITSIIFAALNAIYGQPALTKYLSTALAIGGLLLVIWAAILVMIENLRIQLVIDSELSDLPELVQAAGDTGRIGAETRGDGPNYVSAG